MRVQLLNAELSRSLQRLNTDEAKEQQIVAARAQTEAGAAVGSGEKLSSDISYHSDNPDDNQCS